MPQADAASQGAPKDTAAALAAALRALADAVEAQPELLSLAADAMSEDFMAARAPPAAGQASRLAKALRITKRHVFALWPPPAASPSGLSPGPGWTSTAARASVTVSRSPCLLAPECCRVGHLAVVWRMPQFRQENPE